MSSPVSMVSVKDAICSQAIEDFKYITSKSYEVSAAAKAQTQAQQAKSNKERFSGYVKMCLFGLGTMWWVGASKVLQHMKEADKGVNEYYVMFLTAAFVCALIGLAAGTFYTSFPWAKFFSGLGAWQSFLFVLALFHLEILQYYKRPDDAVNSCYITILLVTILWAVGVQDPLFLHSMGKFVVVVVFDSFYALRWLWRHRGDIWSKMKQAICCFASTTDFLPGAHHRQS